MSVRRRGLASGAAVLAGYLATCASLTWGTAGVGETVAAPGPAPLDAAVGLAAALAAWLVLTWLAAAVLVSLAATAGAGGRLERVAERLAPMVLRRLAAAALGVSLAGVAGVAGSGAPSAAAADPVHASMATVASAAAGDHGGPGGADGRAVAHVLDVLDVLDLLDALDRPADDLSGWTPDRPAAAPRRSAVAPVHLVTAVPGAGRSVADEVVVRRGDTLWDIAARHLGPGASAADVATEWPRWHDANRRQIGADPDLILPGLRLTPPDPAYTD